MPKRKVDNSRAHLWYQRHYAAEQAINEAAKDASCAAVKLVPPTLRGPYTPTPLPDHMLFKGEELAYIQRLANERNPYDPMRTILLAKRTMGVDVRACFGLQHLKLW